MNTRATAADGTTGGMETGAATRAGWRSLLPTKTEALVGLGLAFYMAWVDCTFHGSQMINIEPSVFPELALNRAVYLISIVVLCAALLACTLFHGAVDRVLYRPPMLRAMPAAMCASTLALLGVSLGGTAGWAFVAVAGVCTALSSSICLLHWGSACSAMNMHEIVEVAVVGHVGSAVLATVFQWVATLQCAGPVVMGAALIVLDALFPLLSGAILLRYAQREGIVVAPDPVGAGAGGCTGGGATETGEEDRQSEARAIIGRLAVATLVIGFVLSTCRDLSFAIGGQDGYVGGSPDVFLGIAALTLVGGALICRAFFSDDPHRRVGVCYRVLILFAIAGACCVAAPLTLENARLSTTSILSLGTLRCCNILMWITTAGICRRYRSRITAYFSTVRLCWALGPLLGSTFCMAATAGGVSTQALYAQGFISVIALFAAYAFILTEGTLGEALSLMPRKYRRPFKERCGEAARIYGLTDRELEVMMLFAKGRDSAFIQKELSLSKSTVSTHRQHIYGKLGVHSQQELLTVLFNLENDAR